ncbi:DHA2 family efflux MFS transporter permease subunit [Nocardia sp. alder85J]|uniref:DHA2 family efflux MFS transporter permease subunit n=1 Tax=Nocardia sp. alder85J TaxID=2862949 RepID=UPI001CD1FF8B|nr:DHA2 family efflux MFS transporter permease subunit [Nocardia sp. alder85J]MCX4092636.1 DHA2 family efflux MFS transporter permease subunit [Nocardia sp. alder85J]
MTETVTAAATPRLGPVVQYALLAGPLLSMLDSSIVNVAVAPIAARLHADLTTVGWTVSGYLLALGAGLAATSYLARRFGTLPVYRSALLLFTLASIACAFAPSIGFLVGARVCQGLSGAPLVPLAMSMLLGGSGATRSMSPVGGVLLFLGPALGPSVGGALIGSVGWRAIFLINAPLGVLALLAALRIPAALAPGRSAGVRFDPVGLVTLAAGLTALLYGTGRGGAHGWAAPGTWAPIAVGAALLAGYVGWASRREHPALDLTVARYRSSILALLLCAAASIVTFAAVFLLPVFLQTVQGHSALVTGLAMLPQGILTGLGTVAGQRVLTRVSVRTTVLAGFAVLAVAGAGMLAIGAHTPIAVTATVLAARSVSVGLVITPLLAVLLQPLPPQRLADANTVFSIWQRIAGSFGVGGIASWYASAMVHHGPVAALHQTTWGLIALAALAIPVALALPVTRNTALL